MSSPFQPAPASFSTVEFTHFHFCMGLGGFAKGMNRSTAKVGAFNARMRCIGGVDSDPAAVADFTRLSGVQGTLLDLFSPEQYEAFHGHVPPTGWRPANADDIRRAAGGERPDVVCISAPCKGLSGLLSEEKSQSTKYQALNQLTERCVFLMMEAWPDKPPGIVVFENVPRIATRGRPMLDRIQATLHHYGFAVAETAHDCGRIGRLAQSRKRFLMLARHMATVPPFLYEPDQHPLRAVGDVLQDFPMPGDIGAGPMHRMPQLQWKTWVRLAFVTAGKDWRSLNDLRVVDGMLADFSIVPEATWRDGTMGVLPWDKPAGVITSNAEATTGRYSVADPRGDAMRRNAAHGVIAWEDSVGAIAGESFPSNGCYAVADPRDGSGRHNGYMGVTPWAEPAGTVTSGSRPSQGTFAVADPRETVERRGAFSVSDPRLDAVVDYGQYGVRLWGDSTGVVTSQRAPGQGFFSVADPRVDGHEKSVQLGVRRWDQTAGVVTGKMFAGGGPNSVADPRPGLKAASHHSLYRVVAYGETAGTVTGAGHVAGGAPSIADPRHHGPAKHNNCFRVVAFKDPSGAVTAGTGPTAGGLAVADPRRPGAERGGKYHVAQFDQSSRCVIGASTTGDGAFAVADPRTGWKDGAHQNKLRVTPFGGSVGAITGSAASGHGFTSGAMAVADPRPSFADGKDAYQNSGQYGVVKWGDSAYAVTGAGQHDNGRWSLADPREMAGAEPVLSALPAAEDRLVAVIRALDGTWHRPFTTLELAALQSLVKPGENFVLDGTSDSAWRERIGNAVPPDSAEAVGNVILTTLLLALTGQTFMLSTQPIWVQQIALGLAIDTSPNRMILDMDSTAPAAMVRN